MSSCLYAITRVSDKFLIPLLNSLLCVRALFLLSCVCSAEENQGNPIRMQSCYLTRQYKHKQRLRNEACMTI